MPVLAFTDDIKLISESNRKAIQYAMSLINKWSKGNAIPLAAEKCSVLHCGHNNPKHILTYSLKSQLIKESSVFMDQGIQQKGQCDYQEHITPLTVLGWRLVGAILTVFSSRATNVLWLPLSLEWNQS